jgi:hypothetical protein
MPGHDMVWKVTEAAGREGRSGEGRSREGRSREGMVAQAEFCLSPEAFPEKLGEVPMSLPRTFRCRRTIMVNRRAQGQKRTGDQGEHGFPGSRGEGAGKW